MSKKKVYDYILDGSNALYQNEKWGDKKITIDGEEYEAINLDRLKLEVEYFTDRGYNVLVCVDYSTTKKGSKLFTTSKTKFTKYLNEIQAVKIQNDSELVKFKRENPGSIIVTNDGFSDWISGKETVAEITTADWQKEEKERKEFGFKEGKFTLARENHKFTTGKELPKKQKSKEKASGQMSKSSNDQDRINSQLQSLDARTRNLTSKIDGLSSLVEGLLSSKTKSNSSALMPCKLEDEFGQSHLCLLGENLHIWNEGKWIEIALGGN
jgi:hypothetical protein